MNLPWEHIHTRLRNYQHLQIQIPSQANSQTIVASPLQRAGVAIVLRFQRDAPDALLMKRVVHVQDRWSGQVSLPGGKAHHPGEHPLDVAIRETREEVGLDLNFMAQYIGPLDEVQAIGRGKLLPLMIHPFVFIQTQERPLVLNEEAEAAFWLPLDQVVAGTLDSSYIYESPQTGIMQFPCWNYQGYTIWGLTYRMLSRLLEIIK